MLEWLEIHGSEILTWVIAITGLLVAVYNLIRVIKLGGKIKETTNNMNNQIQVTQEGIVEAFKTARIPSELKISINNSVKDILGQMRDQIITEIKKNEELRTRLTVLTAKILKFTAASNKLTDEEKNQLEDLIKQISDEDNTIDV